ncbi:hypothetical protein GCM10009682_51830 [Luedemannella flava]|uniref:Uncharacterized protein n=1 Tax=Luedemannella flava TaxID=349316 RepID=A0ABP4YQ02_9ACTN
MKGRNGSPSPIVANVSAVFPAATAAPSRTTKAVRSVDLPTEGPPEG